MKSTDEQPLQNGGIHFHSADYEAGMTSVRQPIKTGGKRHRIQKLEDSTLHILTAISESIQKNELRMHDAESRDKLKREWQQMALVVDRLLLIIFIFLTVGVTAGILLQGMVVYQQSLDLL